MNNLRILNKPQTSCEDFDLIHIRNDKHSPNKNTNKISECSLFIEDRAYKQIKTSIRYEDYMCRGAWGVIADKHTTTILSRIDYTKYATETMGGGKYIDRSDIITAYKEAMI